MIENTFALLFNHLRHKQWNGFYLTNKRRVYVLLVWSGFSRISGWNTGETFQLAVMEGRTASAKVFCPLQLETFESKWTDIRSPCTPPDTARGALMMGQTWRRACHQHELQGTLSTFDFIFEFFSKMDSACNYVMFWSCRVSFKLKVSKNAATASGWALLFNMAVSFHSWISVRHASPASITKFIQMALTSVFFSEKSFYSRNGWGLRGGGVREQRCG